MAVDSRDPYLVIERNVARRLRDDDAHRRVSAALAQVAASALHPGRFGAPGEPLMTGLLEDPVASATHVAVETLIDEIDDLVDTMPPGTLEQLAAEQLAADLGLE